MFPSSSIIAYTTADPFSISSRAGPGKRSYPQHRLTTADGSNNSLGVRFGRNRHSSRAVAAVTNLAEPNGGVLLAERGTLALMHQRCRLTTTLSTKGNKADSHRVDRVELPQGDASLTARAIPPSRQSCPTLRDHLAPLLAIRRPTHANGLFRPAGTLAVFLAAAAARALSHQTAKSPRRNHRHSTGNWSLYVCPPQRVRPPARADYRRFSENRQDRSAGEGAITGGKQDTAAAALTDTVRRLGGPLKK